MSSSTGPAVVSVPEVDAGRISADDRLRWQWRAARVLADLIELASRAGLSSAILAYNRASAMRPFGFLTGPGVQPANTLEEAVEFPQALDPTPVGSRFRSSVPGNAPRARWVAGQRYQAGHLPGGAADNLGDVALGTGSKGVESR
jgi:hypothetical protein